MDGATPDRTYVPDGSYAHDWTHIGGTLAVIAGVLVVIVAGFIVKVIMDNRRIPTQRDTPRSECSPVIGKLVPVRFAAVVKAGQARDMGTAPEIAGKLFSAASSRWAGPDELWSAKCGRMGISKLEEYPQDADWDVLITFTAEMPESEIPKNRISMRSCLDDLNGKKILKHADLYDCPLALDPLRFGFQSG